MMLVAAVLFAGIGTAVWVGYWVNADAEKDWRIEAQREAGWLSQTARFSMEQGRSSLRSFSGLFLDTDGVSPAEFVAAANVVQSGDAPLRFHGYAFVRRVNGNERESYERALGAVMTDPSMPGQRAPDMAEHFPVILTSMPGGGLFAPANDLAAVDAMREAVSLAYHTPEQVVLGPAFKMNDAQTCAVIAFSTKSGDQRGVLVGLLNITGFFEDLATATPYGLRLRVVYFDPADTRLETPVAVVGDVQPPNNVQETLFTHIVQGQSSWGLYWDVMPDFAGGPHLSRGRIIMVAGTMMALLVALLLALFVQQNAVVSGIVRLRTRELRQARDEAEQASRAKTDFLANMSHELRTPLNAIIGFSEVLESETFGPLGQARYRQYAADIHSSGHHLLEMINDILDVSKAEVGQIELHEDELDLRHLIQSAMTFVTDSAKRNGLTLNFEAANDLPRLRADELRCRQILINLLSNAVKFTRSGGRVTAGAQLGVDGRIAIFVTDTGVGIAPEDVPVALAEFGQIGNPHIRQDEGTGLGLPLAKRLAELHGADLAIDSALGKGTTVEVIFPRERTAFEAAAE
ncbi:MAG: hypothetical protein HOH66_05275 [Rhodospirillaceae bacterium]|nr:hypothetical protein [Rhodospirillaceae bacterium]MBT6117257.1 hypothetical protein [Rhodospirillaceae bacterium]